MLHLKEKSLTRDAPQNNRKPGLALLAMSMQKKMQIKKHELWMGTRPGLASKGNNTVPSAAAGTRPCSAPWGLPAPRAGVSSEAAAGLPSHPEAAPVIPSRPDPLSKPTSLPQTYCFLLGMRKESLHDSTLETEDETR